MNLPPILTDDTILQRDCDLESLANMSSSDLSVFSDVVAPSDNGSDGLPALPADTLDNSTTIPEPPVEPLPVLDSFVPIIERLPGLVLENNSYYLDGPLTETELNQLISYTRRVRVLALTDTPSERHPSVAPETLIQLALRQGPKSPLLSSLERLSLIDADQSLLYLSFCITPSLLSLEIVGIPSTRHILISSFLKELVLRAQQLSNITLSGRLSESCIQSALKFNHLRHLQIIDAAAALDFSFLQDVSALPELESFVIDARTAEYKKRTSKTSFLSPSDGVATASPQSSAKCQTASGTEPSPDIFPQLSKLNIVGHVTLMEDLANYLPFRAVKEISLTLVRAIEAVPQHPSDKLSIEQLQYICDQSPSSYTRTTSSGVRVKYKDFKTKAGGELRLTIKQEEQYRNHLAERLERPDAQELKGTSAIVSQNSSFTDVIEKILVFGAPDSFIIDLSDISSQPVFANTGTSIPSEFSSAAFEALLSNPTLKDLKLAHWISPLDKSIVNSAISSMSMQRLQLPMDQESSITISTLQLIVRSYPRLVYLECFITTPSEVASHLDFRTDINPHDLEVLSVGGGLPPETEDKLAVATYLSLLFPHLKDINTHQGYDGDGWKYIHSLVKMCQTIGLATERRLRRVV